MLSLDVSISTYKPEGILRVEKMLAPLTQREGVRYIVSWQEHENTPVPESLLQRKDTEIFRFEGRGLSNNRNNALDHCKGDIILIADDDLQYYPDFAEKIIDSFESNPLIDLATFKVDYENPKKYPVQDCTLNLPFPKNYFGSSVEISFRREKFKTLRFWGKMGLGNPDLSCGEDELFLISAIKRNFNCRFNNKTIAKHPQSTTGDCVAEGVLRGQGYIICLIYPWSSFLRIPIKAFRVSKNKNSKFLNNLKHLLEGAIKSIKKKKEIPENCRW